MKNGKLVALTAVEKKAHAPKPKKRSYIKK